MFSYYLINKPYGYLTQFHDKEGRPVLKELYKFPRGVYPVGRLDLDSEGLLLLTDDKKLTDFLLNPKNNHEREYYVQIEGEATTKELEPLKHGVVIEKQMTKPAKVKLIQEPPFLWKRNPPVRERKTVPTCWISLTLTEGRNRQVRKMTAATGHPTLRLIRYRIIGVTVEGLQPGDVRKITKEELFKPFLQPGEIASQSKKL